MRLKQISSVLLAGMLASPLLAVSEDPLQQYKIASKAYQNQRYDTAEQEYEGFLQNYSSHRLAPQAKLALGEIKFALKKYPEAADHYSTVMKRFKNTYVGMNAALRFGQCEFNMKKYLNAIDHFKYVKAKGTKVLRAEALLGWAHSLMALKDYEKAEIMFSDLIQSYPKYKRDPMAVVPLGLIYMQRNRLQEASELLSYLPEDLGARYYKGVTLRKLGHTIAASQFFKDVYEEGPHGYWGDKAQLQMAEAYYIVNELNLAYDSYRKVFDNYPGSALRPYALHRIASIHFQLGRFQEAGLKWEQLVRTFEDDVNLPNGIYMLGEMALRQGEYGKAISFFSQITDDHSLRMDAQYKIIWCLAEQKQDEAVVARAEKYLKDYPWGDLAAKTYLLKGLSLQRMKNFREANEAYQIVSDQFGNSIYSEKAMYLMSTSLYQNDQLAEIVTSLNSTLKLAPVSPTKWQANTYLWIAEAYYALGQYDASQRTYQLVVDNYKGTPKLAHAMLGVAASLAKSGNYEEASLAHERALAMADTLKNSDVKRSVLMDTAQVLFTQKKYEKAMGYFNEFVDRYPDNPKVPQALFQAGICFYRLEYYTEAISRWKRIVATYPNHELAPKALYQQAKTLFGLGNYGEASGEFQLLIDKFPEYGKVKEARIQIAQSYYNQGRFDLAIERLQEFLNNYPKDPKAKDVLELLQMAHYRKGKGQTDLALLTEKFPRSKLTADIYWQLGAEAFNKKQYKQGLDYFRKMVGEFPEAKQIGQAYFYMAESYFNLEDYSNSVTAYKNFVLNFPDDASRNQALFRLGVSHFQTENFGEAVIAFNDTLEADPQGSFARDALLNIPFCYKKMGQPSQALKSYERFLVRYPKDQGRDKILMQMGELNEETKKYETALQNYQLVSAGSKSYLDSLISQGRLYRILKLPNKELAIYEKLRSNGPSDDEVRISGLVTLAELYQEMGKIDSSISVYEEIAQQSSNPEWKSAAQERAKILRAEAR